MGCFISPNVPFDHAQYESLTLRIFVESLSQRRVVRVRSQPCLRVGGHVGHVGHSAAVLKTTDLRTICMTVLEAVAPWTFMDIVNKSLSVSSIYWTICVDFIHSQPF